MSYPVEIQTMDGVRVYGEKFKPALGEWVEDRRLIVIAFNEGGDNQTWVDLVDIIDWVKKNRPELLNQ